MDSSNSLDIFYNKDNFEHAQRVAIALSKSSMVPAPYQGEKGVPNVIVALEMAKRIGMSPFMVMQNLHVIQGRPSWSSTFLIAAINTCGQFSEALKFKLTGDAQNRSCVAITKDKAGNPIEGPAVTMEMARAEGWVQKNGSKWKTMPELMIRYRAASFFSRLHCPEVSMGMRTVEEELEAEPINETIKLGEVDLSKLTALPDIESAEIVNTETGEITPVEPIIETASVVEEPKGTITFDKSDPSTFERIDFWEHKILEAGKTLNVKDWNAFKKNNKKYIDQFGGKDAQKLLDLLNLAEDVVVKNGK